MTKHRLDIITDAIEQDFDVKKRRNVDGPARVTFEWAKIMQSILKMPVPKWSDPGTVSGEISEAK